MGIAEDIGPGAEWIATALTKSGYRADFTGPSLHEIDRFIEEHTTDGQPNAMGLLGEDTGVRVFSVGAYVGEVIRREKGGRWEVDEDDPTPDVNSALVLDDGSLVWPVQLVIRRILNGEADGIAAYSAGRGVHVGPKITRRYDSF